jgi:GntR family transcriptional regulator
MEIDLASHVPIFEQIAHGIRREIARGIYRPGEGLPGIRPLAVELRVNHNTVQKAYDLLERDALIRTRRGIGMFVTGAAAQAATEEVLSAARAGLADAVKRCVLAGLDPDEIRTLVEEAVDSADTGAGSDAT